MRKTGKESQSEPKRIVVDFGLKKTEADWFKTWDRFALAVAPFWFSYLSWVFIFGAVRYFGRINSSGGFRVVLGVVEVCCFWFLWIYTQAVCYKIEFRNIPLFKKSKSAWIVSLCVSGILALVLFMFANHLSIIVMKQTGSP